jgi:primase-like protein
VTGAPLAPLLIITLGRGLTQPQGRRVLLVDEPVATLAATLRAHMGADAWWSACAYTGDYRVGERWEAACATPLDLDYHDAVGAHVAIPIGVADAVEKALEGASEATPTLTHRTPRGLRAIYLLRAPVTDADLYRRACHGAAALVSAALSTSGLLAAKGCGGLVVDNAVTGDLARLLFAPRATVRGIARSASVITMREATFAAEVLAEATPDPHEACGGNGHNARPGTFSSPLPNSTISRRADLGALGAPEGARNATLFRLGCRLVSRGYSQTMVAGMVRDANARCAPRLGDREVRGILRSIERYRRP